jgi:hypothetical protein
MKSPFGLLRWLLALAIGISIGAAIANRQLRLHYEQLRAAELEQAEAEKALLRAAVAEAQNRPTPRAIAIPQTAVDKLSDRLSPKEILQRLQILRASGENSQAVLRKAVYYLEELATHGPAALGDIGEFLNRYVDVELDSNAVNKSLPTQFVIPPSLRLALFEIVARSGSPQAEAILAASLSQTGRGIEVACVSRLLDHFSSEDHRAAVLSQARQLLANTAPLNSNSPLDRYHREYLFSVLSRYADTEFVSTAQSQLVRSDNQLDVNALKYLQQALGPAAVSIAAQIYANPGLTNSAAKEPLARLALHFAGATAEANTFYANAINDATLTRSHRKNLIEDLNETGFPNPKDLRPEDLPLIKNRISLIEQLAPAAMDEVNAAALKEAYKDLINMQTKLLPRPATTTP